MRATPPRTLVQAATHWSEGVVFMKQPTLRATGRAALVLSMAFASTMLSAGPAVARSGAPTVHPAYGDTTTSSGPEVFSAQDPYGTSTTQPLVAGQDPYSTSTSTTL